MAVMDYPKGTIVRVLTPEGRPIDVQIGDPGSCSIGHVVQPESDFVSDNTFRVGDLVQLDSQFRAIPYGPNPPEGDHWLITDALSVIWDEEYGTTKYTFPDGEVIWCIGPDRANHRDVTVPKAKASVPERDYWLLSEATKKWYEYDTGQTIYEFSDGRVHKVPSEVATITWGADIRVPKNGTALVTTEVYPYPEWEAPTPGTGAATGVVTFSTGGSSFNEMRKLGEWDCSTKVGADNWAGTQTPRQWLNRRVSEIAEQGRL